MNFSKFRKEVLVEVILIVLPLINLYLAHSFDSFFDEFLVHIVPGSLAEYQVSLECQIMNSAGHRLFGHAVRPLEQVSDGDSGVFAGKEVGALRPINLKRLHHIYH